MLVLTETCLSMFKQDLILLQLLFVSYVLEAGKTQLHFHFDRVDLGLSR